ncbi:MAG: hypothetical protein JW754_03565 [Candidatus Aenigmarchaeota archaeon]|nr:hypothetical protein [Candidatus Aenigmarchaeota archaeon]
MKDYKTLESEGNGSLYTIEGRKGSYAAFGEGSGYGVRGPDEVSLFESPINEVVPSDREIEAVRRVLNGEKTVYRVSQKKLKGILGDNGYHLGACVNGRSYVNENLSEGQMLGVSAHEAIEGETPGTSIHAYGGLDPRHKKVEMKTLRSLQILSDEGGTVGRKASKALTEYVSLIADAAYRGDPLSLEVMGELMN